MGQEQCRQGILRQWHERGPHSSDADRKAFIVWLVLNRPDLLAFRGLDRWQTINGWLLQDEH